MRGDPPLVVALGAVLWDVFPDGARLGGAPANFAVHAAALGARSALVSCVGNDEMGRNALDILRDRGVVTDAVQVHPHRPTGSVSVTLTDGQPDYEIVEDVAWDAVTWHSELARWARSARALCFGTLDQRDPQSRRAIAKFLDAASPACLRVLDLNFRQHFHAEEVVLSSLARADVLKLNGGEVPVLRDYVGGVADVDDFLTELRARFDLQCVVLTLGADGCRVIGDAGICQAVGEKRRVVNTVGAGCVHSGIRPAFAQRRDDPNLRRTRQCHRRLRHHAGQRDADVAREVSGVGLVRSPSFGRRAFAYIIKISG